MSSVFPPKIGFARKTGTAILGVTLLGSLMLTACAPASDNGEGTGPSASASATAEAERGVQKFQSEAFDLSKQVSLNVKNEETNIVLNNGVVTQEKEGDKWAVKLTPFEKDDKEWKYATDFASNDGRNITTHLMQWEGKQYIVVHGTKEENTDASGLTAAKRTTTNIDVIINAKSGVVVNTFKSEPSEVGASSPATFFLSNTVRKGGVHNADIPQAFQTGLVYTNNQQQIRLVNPVTGATVVTETYTGQPPLNNEKGFYGDRDTPGFVYEKTIVRAVSGNYALVSNKLPEVQAKSGAYIQVGNYALVDTRTMSVISQMNCADTGDPLKSSSSPDGRYVNFLGAYVFDTQTGASFCTMPADNLEIRQFTASAVDNDGNMFGTTRSSIGDNGKAPEYLKISIADLTKVETISTYEAEAYLPVLFTEKGSAVFYSDNSRDVLVVVPAK